MITENELRISNESYTHKDFYQIYPEILDLVNKITERWDPASSNESDPGVVLLKLLAFIADKNNYNIDKNILEMFMPSATQQDSMRKLCDMMGYEMKYYRSAVTDVSFMWVGEHLPDVPNQKNSIILDRFTELQDDTGEVNYILTEPVTLTYKGETVTKPAIEGTLQEIEINTDNLVRLYNLDDHRRFYFPESQVAENGVWIWKDVDENTTDPEFWTKVDNLNVQKPGTPVWKFGFDSKKRLPYILFPEDIAELIGEGLHIKYIRTSGANGNITAKTLTKLTKLNAVNFYNGSSLDPEYPTLDIASGNDTYLIIQNASYTLNGQDIETLDEAYNNFKKTIGTFDTLVTCRDYANKIYQLTYSDINTNALVSNVQVSDIKDDINFADKIVTFDQFGMFYSDVAEMKATPHTVSELPDPSTLTAPGIYYCNGKYYEAAEGDNGYYYIQSSAESLNKINNFDLYIYPLKDIVNFYNVQNYTASFKPNYDNTYEIINKLQDYKTLTHNIKQVSNSEGSTDIYNIKNYYHLSARISTTYKVTEYEGTQILNNIYFALWKNFNARKLDYGEEIPYDELLNVIQNADTRIKFVSLDEPDLKTVVMYGNGNEHTILNYGDGAQVNPDSVSLFYKLVAKNVLAGRLPLFDYDKRFAYAIGETNALDDNKICGNVSSYPEPDPLDPSVAPEPSHDGSDAEKYSVTFLTSKLDIPESRLSTATYTLKANEIIQFIAPSLSTAEKGIYSSYINYYFNSPSHRNNDNYRACRLTNLLSRYKEYYLIIVTDDQGNYVYTEALTHQFADLSELYAYVSNMRPNTYLWYWDFDTTNQRYIWQPVTTSWTGDLAQTQFYTVKSISNEDNLFNYLADFYHFNNDDSNLNGGGIYTIASSNITNVPGRLIDESGNKFVSVTSFKNQSSLYAFMTASDKALLKLMHVKFDDTTTDDEGETPASSFIKANTEYKLADKDVLYINYTDSNDIVHNIEYYYSNGSYYKRDDTSGQNTGIPEKFSGIIKANFDLYDSAVEAVSGAGRSYSKKTGYSWSEVEVPGMFALQGQDQIEIRSFVETYIKESPTYCYWSLNNNNNLILKEVSTDILGKKKYQYILNNNEYFFYTGALKNSLVTLGAGTSLNIYMPADTSKTQLVYTLNDSDLDLDDIASQGIGAFSDTAWVSMKFNETQYLRIQENQIITLSEGDYVTGFAENGSLGTLTNTWYKIKNPAGITYNGRYLPKSCDQNIATEDKNFLDWQVRSCLNIDMNANEGQYLEQDGDVIQTIILYTSDWKDPVTGNYMVYSPAIADRLQEMYGDNVNGPDTRIKTFTTQDKSYRLKSNYPVIIAGGEFLSVHRFTVDGVEKDDLYIYAYDAKSIDVKKANDSTQTWDNTFPISMYADSYYRWSLKEVKSIKLPIFKPDNCFDLMMIYYTPSETLSEEKYAKVIIANEAEQKQAGISFYSDNYNRQDTATDELQLKKGLNIIRLDVGGYVIITAAEDASVPENNDSGSIVVSNIDVVKLDAHAQDNNNYTGVNYTLLNVKPVDCPTFISNYIKSIDFDNKFYYNVPVSKYNQLDVDIMNQQSFFNYNNICNKFVIAELDSDFSDIQIAKSSRVAKW